MVIGIRPVKDGKDILYDVSVYDDSNDTYTQLYTKDRNFDQIIDDIIK